MRRPRSLGSTRLHDRLVDLLSRARRGKWNAAAILAVAVTALGLALRIEHALTFNGPARGADYGAHLQGVRWTLEHMRPFDFDPTVNIQVGFYPPLWYALSALILHLTGAERPIAALAVFGWLVRQLVLAKLLKEAIPRHRWSALAALSINAVLPLGVLIDGKVNPEGLHASLFMVAVYWLWRMEREAGGAEGIKTRTAVWFGVFAGLALLTKATAALLLITAVAVLVWRAARLLLTVGRTAAWTRIMRPAVVAALAWCVVAGWWCGPNLVKYKHPFPHLWDRETFATNPEHPELLLPAEYRRPLGWALPFTWKEYLDSPIIASPGEPRPNFWAAAVTGTWSDLYNRGFCRLTGGAKTDHVWGAYDSVWGGPDWFVSERCVAVYKVLLRVGLWITLATVLAVCFTARKHIRSKYQAGSLVLPVICVLGVLFLMLFALMYPYDGAAVLNPRYLLPVTTPMAACLGIALGQFEASRLTRGFLHAFVFLAIGLCAVLVVFERWGH